MPRPSEPFFQQSLESVDQEIHALTAAESRRQEGKVILIASESICPSPVAEAFSSPFSAIYAEGYPSTRMSVWERDFVEDRPRHLAFNRRYADRRYYKGCEYVNFVEVLAQKRAAGLFAANGLRPDDLFVNVQPLSGSAANNAVYTAFLEPGDTIMGMALPHGGHLSHGSVLNRSGMLYRVVPYVLDPDTYRLDYDAIKDMARRHRPRMLIAGGSAYPWALDWRALREAADGVPGGCLLLADISHPAGLVAAGEFPSPVGFADVISMTTHKTLCGPRGAVIITTDPDRAKAVDLGVFPGEQGGPHVHQIAAKAVAFGLAATDPFKALMRQVRANADAFARSLVDLGCPVAGGGTESHLLLVDLKGLAREGGAPLYGDIAANLLDLCNITLNKNTIAGDTSAAHPSGLRIGTTLVSQQGYVEEDMATLAGLIHRLLTAARTFEITTPGGVRGRARVPLEVLEEVRAAVEDLTGSRAPDAVPPEPPEGAAVKDGAGALAVRGERAGVFLQSVLTTDVLAVEEGARERSLMLDDAGRVLAEVEVQRLPRAGRFETYLLSMAAQGVPLVESWLRGLSDGYLEFDPDPTRKVDGPVAVLRTAPASGTPSLSEPAPPGEREEARERYRREPGHFAVQKPYFVSRAAVDESRPMAAAAPPWRFRAPQRGELLQTPLNPAHRRLTAANNMVPFAGWEMPVLFTSIREEHRAVRRACGLFDLGHMGTLDVRGPGATRLLDLLTTNFVWRLRPKSSQYTYMLRPDGSVLDDLLIYMLEDEHFMLVANAANADEVLAFVQAAASGQTALSRERPDMLPDARPAVRNLKDQGEAGDDMKINLGLQGPASGRVLLRFAAASPEAARILGGLHRGDLARVRVEGFDLVVSFTGYTGEEVGYEIFVHPDRAEELWTRLLDTGSGDGLVPCGLGARDSLRCEAGLPLHGHELAGPHDLLPAEAGYAGFVKEHKPFFSGREPHLKRARTSRRRIARVRLERTGVRMLQPGDPVADLRGRVVGTVTSAVLPGEHQVALVLLERAAAPGSRLLVLPRPRRAEPSTFKPVEELGPGDRVPVGEACLVLDRFPGRSGEEAAAGTG